jgi:hypothetical protein
VLIVRLISQRSSAAAVLGIEEVEVAAGAAIGAESPAAVERRAASGAGIRVQCNAAVRAEPYRLAGQGLEASGAPGEFAAFILQGPVLIVLAGYQVVNNVLIFRMTPQQAIQQPTVDVSGLATLVDSRMPAPITAEKATHPPFCIC